MPFIPHTPESLVNRSDSKNPATTCKGITTGGRHCRRNLTLTSRSLSGFNRKSKQGVLAVPQPNDSENDRAAAYFCWQHKDQATKLMTSDHNRRSADIVPVKARTSIDTIAERLGFLEVENSGTAEKKRRQYTRPDRKQTIPRKFQDAERPMCDSPRQSLWPAEQLSSAGKSHKRKQSNVGLFCCIRSTDNDHLPPIRVRRYPEKREDVHSMNVKVPSHAQQSSRPPLGRPAHRRDRPSQTQGFLSLIPRSLSPQTTALLLAELAKPVSPHDEEGYIYIFWLTDAATAPPDSQAALSLLTDSADSMPSGYRTNGFLQAHGRKIGMANKSTILLKIGRASNVQRRMNEWTRQCGYNLSLIRYYPYISSSPSGSSEPTSPASPSNPNKVPHAHRVERLIHLELAHKVIKRDCESCGKEHREWFEVESSRMGLKSVDEVVRRWVRWGQRMG